MRPARLSWNQKLSVDSAITGDVLVYSWNIWLSGPCALFSLRMILIPPAPLLWNMMEYVYGHMLWESPVSSRGVLNFKSAHISLGNVITSHAFGGIGRYSIHSQVHPCDQTLYPIMRVRWPLVDGTGAEPTPAQKISDLGGRPFWLRKIPRGDLFTVGSLPN